DVSLCQRQDANSYCNLQDYKCACVEGYHMDESSLCLSNIGSACMENADCEILDSLSYCTVENICSCYPGYSAIGSGMCMVLGLPGIDCTSAPSVCRAIDFNSECREDSGACLCR
ncbi:unnamed protein product, partial [Owenia fusiformis]